MVAEPCNDLQINARAPYRSRDPGDHGSVARSPPKNDDRIPEDNGAAKIAESRRTKSNGCTDESGPSGSRSPAMESRKRRPDVPAQQPTGDGEFADVETCYKSWAAGKE